MIDNTTDYEKKFTSCTISDYLKEKYGDEVCHQIIDFRSVPNTTDVKISPQNGNEYGCL